MKKCEHCGKEYVKDESDYLKNLKGRLMYGERGIYF